MVISHDRYLLERVTDNQFAVMDGHVRHLPRGVDEYLELRTKQMAAPKKGTATGAPTSHGSAGFESAESSGSAAPAARVSSLTGADLRNAEKEFSSIERKIAKQQGDVKTIHAKMAAHDPNDYVGLGALSDDVGKAESTIADLETRWVELSELLAKD
ncbi:MAG: ATPase subunit of ABC transporter with duplicated ATPase domains [Alpinimonas sp.]